jgi:hypothetical protein
VAAGVVSVFALVCVSDKAISSVLVHLLRRQAASCLPAPLVGRRLIARIILREQDNDVYFSSGN